ncbi:MAG: cyclic pyranopterin monophosphate synthase MoaC [Pseudomonadota bacterium]
MKLYSFDVDGESLELLPLAARRALDLAGYKLSLEGWKSLDIAARKALASIGSETEVDTAEVERSTAPARPAAARCPTLPDPPRTVPSPALVEAFAPYGRLTTAIWSSLDDVDRYALNKVARRGDPERMRAAHAEIIGHRQVSTHLGPRGGVHMVNVSGKEVTERRALAESRVSMNHDAFTLLLTDSVPKGDVLGSARIAGILAAKRTSELIPLCHSLPLTQLSVDLTLDEEDSAVAIQVSVRTEAKTGVEMEALVAASVAALTVYDMLKAVDRSMIIGPTRLLAKSGGASGDFRAAESAPAREHR